MHWSLARHGFLGLIVFILSLFMAAIYVSARDGDNREPLAPLRFPPPLDQAKVALGARLFADPILSSKKKFSCATCHDLEAGGTINVKRTLGYQGRLHQFNAPTIFNVGNNYRFGWRGDFTALEDQNEKILLDENIMASTWPMLLGRLRETIVYSVEFQRIYGRPVSRRDLLDVLATFQRSLTTPNSAFDRYLGGDMSALSSTQIEGYRIFKEYGCVSCHQGSNIGGNMYQKFGIFSVPLKDELQTSGDLGRYTLTYENEDKGVFRVPSLRNVAVTAPYFHDGRLADLPEAVSTMARAQLGRTLAPSEIDKLVAFLNALTGEYNGRKLQSTSTGQE